MARLGLFMKMIYGGKADLEAQEPERDGRNKDSWGNAIMKIKTKTIMPHTTKISGKVSSTLIFRIRVDVNRQTAMGGVHPPMAKATQRMMPKWTTSYPMDSITGQRIGVNKIRRELVSIKVPRMMSSVTTRAVITSLLPLMDKMAFAISMGMLFLDRTHPKGAEAETMMRIKAVPIALCFVIAIKVLRSISRYTKAERKSA